MTSTFGRTCTSRNSPAPIPLTPPNTPKSRAVPSLKEDQQVKRAAQWYARKHTAEEILRSYGDPALRKIVKTKGGSDVLKYIFNVKDHLFPAKVKTADHNWRKGYVTYSTAPTKSRNMTSEIVVSRSGDGSKPGTGIVRQPKKKANGLSIRRPKSRSGLKPVTAAPLARGRMVVTKAPMIDGRAAKNCTNVRHRELVVSSLPGSTLFTIQNTLQINPGLILFPWLSLQAQGWEQYVINSMTVQYVPITSATTVGDILLVPDFDCSDAAPSNEVAAANNYLSVTNSCWNPINLRLSKSQLMNPGPRKYIRRSLLAGDIKTYDAANIYIITSGQASTAAVGKIYIEYDIDLFFPSAAMPAAVPPAETTVIQSAGSQTIPRNVLTNLLFAAINYGDGLRIFPTTVFPATVFTMPSCCVRIQVTTTARSDNVARCIFDLQLRRNGLNIPTAQACYVEVSFANSGITNHADYVVQFTQGDTFSVHLNALTSAGTITVEQVNCNITLA